MPGAAQLESGTLFKVPAGLAGRTERQVVIVRVDSQDARGCVRIVGLQPDDGLAAIYFHSAQYGALWT